MNSLACYSVTASLRSGPAAGGAHCDKVSRRVMCPAAQDGRALAPVGPSRITGMITVFQASLWVSDSVTVTVMEPGMRGVTSNSDTNGTHSGGTA